MLPALVGADEVYSHKSIILDYKQCSCYDKTIILIFLCMYSYVLYVRTGSVHVLLLLLHEYVLLAIESQIQLRLNQQLHNDVSKHAVTGACTSFMFRSK